MITQPNKTCSQCPRLYSFRLKNAQKYIDWHNAPVASFGDPDGQLLIVGLAPGLRGANKTGRPFTGDWAGDLLYATLTKFGFTHGKYGATAEDGLQLLNCRITNAVRCVPPENKPTGEEIKTCNKFLIRELKGMRNLKVILTLGGIAHAAILSALDKKKSDYKFSHNGEFKLNKHLQLVSSYHCSRYNTNTGRLTQEMFETIFENIKTKLQTP